MCPQLTVTLSPGTQLLLYTDGITEAMNHTDEEYGPARLIEHFLQPEACVEGLIAEVQPKIKARIVKGRGFEEVAKSCEVLSSATFIVRPSAR